MTTTNRQISDLKLELQNGRTHRIRDRPSSPRRVSWWCRPSALGLPGPATLRYFIFTLSFSLFFSLTYTGYWIWVNGFLSFSVSLSLSEEWKWNEMRLSLFLSLSLFKTLFDSLFLFELWLADCYCLALFYNFINICPCFWFYPLVLVRYNWLSFSVLWFVIVNLSDWLLWSGAMGLVC